MFHGPMLEGGAPNEYRFKFPQQVGVHSEKLRNFHPNVNACLMGI
jgi:hypothetical protein